MNKIFISILACMITPTTVLAQQDSVKGRLHVDCQQQGATVWVDGVKQGTVPLTLELLGEHNIRVENDINHYYRSTELVDFTPGMDQSRTYTLKAMPHKSYGFLMAQYGVSHKDFGMMLGVCRNWGFFVSARGTFGGEDGHSPYNLVLTEPVPITKLTNPSHFGISAGIMRRIANFLFVYLGAGYADHSPGNVEIATTQNYVRNTKIEPYKYECVTADVGAILKLKALTLSVGYTPAVAKLTGFSDGDKYGDVKIGLGITLHKNRKR